MIGVIAAIAWADPPLVYNGVVHKGSQGMSIVFPDVCKTPLPGGPVPIPYPNLTIATPILIREPERSKRVEISGS